jgi:hypothetical protein
MNNGYCRERITVTVVIDPEAETTEAKKGEAHWMATFEDLPASWMNKVATLCPGHVFREKRGKYTCWEWVS